MNKNKLRKKLAQAEEPSSSGICASCGKLLLRGQSKGQRVNKTGQKMSKFKGRGRKAMEPVK